MKHNIYHLKDTPDSAGGWDSYDSHVVIADTPKEARGECPSANEGSIWPSPVGSTCVKIGESNKGKGVVISSFNAG